MYIKFKMCKILGYPNQPSQPLIRLRIFYDNDNEQFDTLRYENIILALLYFILFSACSQLKECILLVWHKSTVMKLLIQWR